MGNARLNEMYSVSLDRRLGLQTGQKWSDQISKEVERCDAILVLIGPRWLDILTERSASESVDHVSEELERGLRMDKVMIPILIGGASIPDWSRVPESLRGLCHWQPLDINQPQRCMSQITRMLGSWNFENDTR